MKSKCQRRYNVVRLLAVTLGLLLFLMSLSVVGQSTEEDLHELSKCENQSCRNNLCLLIGFRFQKEAAYDKALSYYDQFEVAAEMDTTAILQLLKGKAFCQEQIGQPEKALENYVNSFHFLKSTQAKEMIYQLDRIIELNALGLKNYRAAVPYALRLTSLLKQQRDYSHLAQVYNSLGFIYRRLKSQDVSLRYYRLCRQLLYASPSVINDRDKGNLLLNMGVLFTERGELDSAQAEFKEALRIAKSNNEVLTEVITLNYTAGFFFCIKKYKLAEETLKDALLKAAILPPTVSAKRALVQTFELNSEVLLFENRHEEYRKQITEVKKVKAEIAKIEQDEIRELQQNLVRSERKEFENRIQQKQAALQEAEFQQAKLWQRQAEQELTIRQREFDLLSQKNKFYVQQDQLSKVRLANQRLQQEQLKLALDAAQQRAAATENRQKLLRLDQARLISSLKLREGKVDAAKAAQLQIYLLTFCIATFFGLVVLFFFFRKNVKVKKIMARQHDQIETQLKEREKQNEQLSALFAEVQEKKKSIEEMQEELKANNHSLNLSNNLLEQVVRERTDDLVTVNHELVHRITQIEEFASIVSHNIRGPIARIMGLAKVLEMEKIELPTQFLDIKDRLVTSALEADQVLKDLNLILEVRSISMNRFELVEVEAALTEALTGFDGSSHFAIKFQNPEQLRVVGVRRFLVQVFSSLISNAIKFRKSSLQLRIDVKVFSNNDRIWIRFSDNGVGFDLQRYESKVCRMYQKFHPETKGKGLGLFLSKNQVEVMNGGISVESEEGAGTSVLMNFPI